MAKLKKFGKLESWNDLYLELKGVLNSGTFHWVNIILNGSNLIRLKLLLVISQIIYTMSKTM